MLYDSLFLCTFSNIDEYQKDISKILKIHSVVGNRIFVLQNKTNFNEIFLTYNVTDKCAVDATNTVIAHRKRRLNVIYSINALNEILALKTNQSIGENYKIDWANYKNKLILIRNKKLEIVSTKIYSIIDTEKFIIS